MRKVQLVFVKSFLDVPTWNDTFSKMVEIEEPAEFADKSIHLIAARVVAAGDSPSQSDQPLTGDFNAIIVDGRDFSSLLGKLLTQIDATFGDTDQRKAQKDLVKSLVWDFEKDMRERAVQTVDSRPEVQ
jgi:hypothetical protein